MHEDKGVDFDIMLQAQQADTCLQTHHQELLDSDSSDEESAADLDVNVHDLEPKIQGLMEFSDLDSEDEFALDCPTAMEEALAIDARGEIDDPDTSEEESVEQKSTAKMFKGMLQISDSEDEDEAGFQLRKHGFTSSSKEAVAVKGKDLIEGEGDKSVIGEQEGNTSCLTDTAATQTDADQLMSSMLKTDHETFLKVTTKTKSREKLECMRKRPKQ